MSYEDAIRVAHLKTRAGRFERIAPGRGADGGEIVVTDYLKPDLDEIYGVLPDRLVAPFARWAERRWPHGRPPLGQHVQHDDGQRLPARLAAGAAAARCGRSPTAPTRSTRGSRAGSTRCRRCAALDAELAREVAQAAQLVKGYGDVRRRMVAHFDRLLETVTQMAERHAGNGGGFEEPRRLASRYRALVLKGPDSEAAAAALAADALARR